MCFFYVTGTELCLQVRYKHLIVVVVKCRECNDTKNMLLGGCGVLLVWENLCIKVVRGCVWVCQETGLGVKKFASFPHNFTSPTHWFAEQKQGQFRILWSKEWVWEGGVGGVEPLAGQTLQTITPPPGSSTTVAWILWWQVIGSDPAVIYYFSEFK